MNRTAVLLLGVVTACFLACSAGGGDEGPSVCEPDCTDRECGLDGCGGTCGTCTTGTCSAGSCCVPDCDGKACGSDGCGGSCGECGRGEGCLTNGQCEPLPGIGNTCASNGDCTPGLTCRSDEAFSVVRPTSGHCLACMTLAGECEVDEDCCSGFCVPGTESYSGRKFCAVTRYDSCGAHSTPFEGPCCSGESTDVSAGIGAWPYICVGCGSVGASPCQTGLDCCSGVCDRSTQWCK
jgi:hypothetical protein